MLSRFSQRTPSARVLRTIVLPLSLLYFVCLGFYVQGRVATAERTHAYTQDRMASVLVQAANTHGPSLQQALPTFAAHYEVERIWIVGAEGQVLMSNQRAERGQRLAQVGGREMVDIRAAQFVDVTLNNQTHTAWHVAPLPFGQELVVVAHSKFFNSGAGRVVLWGLIGGLLLWGLFIGAVWVLTLNLLTRPIAQLRTLAEQLAEGESPSSASLARVHAQTQGTLGELSDHVLDFAQRHAETSAVAQSALLTSGSLMDLTEDLVFVATLKGQLIGVNQAFRARLHLPDSWHVGKARPALKQLVPLDTVLALTRPSAPADKRICTDFHTVDGKTVPVSLAVRMIPYQKTTAFLCIATDQTAHPAPEPSMETAEAVLLEEEGSALENKTEDPAEVTTAETPAVSTIEPEDAPSIHPKLNRHKKKGADTEADVEEALGVAIDQLTEIQDHTEYGLKTS